MRATSHLPFVSTIGALCALTLMLAASTVPAFAGKPGPALKPLTVCLDAGHGGGDPGATWYGLEEKVLTLQIAQQLESKLESSGYGFSVVMTRTTNEQSLGNTDRAVICNNARADTVLSIHLNASTNTSYDYFQAFYGKQTKDGEFTRYIWDYYNLSTPDGAAPLQKNNPTQFASGLLLKTNAPAALAETVFLSHKPEADVLITGSRQPQIVDQLYLGLVAYYRSRGLISP